MSGAHFCGNFQYIRHSILPIPAHEIMREQRCARPRLAHGIIRGRPSRTPSAKQLRRPLNIVAPASSTKILHVISSRCLAYGRAGASPCSLSWSRGAPTQCLGLDLRQIGRIMDGAHPDPTSGLSQDLGGFVREGVAVLSLDFAGARCPSFQCHDAAPDACRTVLAVMAARKRAELYKRDPDWVIALERFEPVPWRWEVVDGWASQARVFYL